MYVQFYTSERIVSIEIDPKSLDFNREGDLNIIFKDESAAVEFIKKMKNVSGAIAKQFESDKQYVSISLGIGNYPVKIIP
jgi:hypothetical protein